MAKAKSKGELITQTEAAELRGVTLASIGQLIKRGRLRSEEVYGRTLVYREDVENFEPIKEGRPPKQPAKKTPKKT